MIHVKDAKVDFIQDHRNRYRDHCNGILQWGRDLAKLRMQHGQVGIYSQRSRWSQLVENY